MPIGNKTRGASQSPKANAQITTRDLLNTFFYYRWTATTIVIGVLLLGCIVALLISPTYRAQARLLAFYSNYAQQADRPDARSTPSFEPMQIVSVEAEILASQALHRALISADLPQPPDTDLLERRLESFERRFHIAKVEEANVIELSFVDSDPKRAADTLDRLIALYYKQRIGVFDSGRVAFLASQRDRVKEQLDKANSDLVAFQSSKGIVNIDGQIGEAVVLNGQLVQQQLQLKSSLVENQNALNAVLKESGKVPENIRLFADNTEAARAQSSMQLELLQLQSRKAEMASRYTPDSPFVVQLDKQIKDLQASIDGQKSTLQGAVRTGRNTYYDTIQDRLSQLQANVAGNHAKQETLDSQIAASSARLQDLIATANQIRRMEIDRDLLVDSFKNFSRQLDQAKIEQNQTDTISSTNVRIIQAPYPPAQRSNPPILFIAASLVIGLFAAGFSVIFMSSVRETFLSPEEIERSLALPVLSAQMTPTPSVLASSTLYRRLFGAAGAATKGVAPASVWRFGRMISSINNSSDNNSKVVLLLGTNAEDGVAGVVQALALELERQSTRPVLVIDLGQHSEAGPGRGGPIGWPTGTQAGLDGAGGSLPGQAAVRLAFFHVNRHNIAVAYPHADDLPLLGRETPQLLAALRASFDYIVISAPPMARSFVGIDLAMLADATIVGVRAEATRKPVIMALKNQVEDAGGRIIGTVMIDRHSYIPEFIYRFL